MYSEKYNTGLRIEYDMVTLKCWTKSFPIIRYTCEVWMFSLKQMLYPRDEALWQGSDAEADLVISLALTSPHNVAKKFQ